MTAPDANSSATRTGPAGDYRNIRIIAAVVGAGLLVLLPLRSGLPLPFSLGEGDLGLRFGMLVGTILGATVYWSLPRRGGARQRSRRYMQLVGTVASAWFGGALLSAATLYLSDEPVFGAEMGATAIYGLWCAIAITFAFMFARETGRRRVSRSRRGRSEMAEASVPRSIESIAPSVRAERDCPWCAERILSRARVCKFCGHDVDPLDG
ncbi:MAG: hypothetical protein M3081_01280 [Gemmatimonadota bacterium]|nr:hypothetical protein [Gemmatimonadota bacterium]